MQPNQEKNPEELLSAAFDHEFTGVVRISEDHRAELENEWESVRSEMRSWPVGPADLVTAVRAEGSRTMNPVSTRQRRKSYRRHVWLATLTAVVTILVLLAVPQVRDHWIDIGEFPLAGLDPASYHVVVVNIDANVDIEDTVREMLGAAEDRGAEVTSLQSEIHEGAQYSAGFLLTAGSESQLIRDSLPSDQESLEWNPTEIDGRSHEEIKALFLSAMKVPTNSDRVFGAMYVVDGSNLSLSMEELPDDTTVLKPSVVAADESESGPVDIRSNSDGVLTPGHAPVTAPLIVIFRKRAVVPALDSDQGKLPHLTNSEPDV